MRKARVFAVASIVAVLLLSACGDSEVAGPKKLSFVVTNTTQNFSKELAAGYLAGASQGGVEAVIRGPAISDAPRQVEDFQAAVKDTPRGVAVKSVSPELFVKPLADAVKAGVPLVLVDTAPSPGSNVQLCVANDHFELGQLLAREIIKKIPADVPGTVVLGSTVPGLSLLDQRAGGMKDEFS